MSLSKVIAISSATIVSCLISISSFANLNCSQQTSENYFKCDNNRIIAIESVDAIANSTKNVTKDNSKAAKAYRFNGNELILS